MAADLSEAPAPAPAPRRRHPVRWAMAAVAALVVLPGVVVLGTRLGEDATAVRSVLVGKPAPEFSLETLDGGRISSADLRGRAYVVNFWASWCVPCRQEHSHLEAFYRRYRPEGVELLGVIFNDTAANARAYQAELGGDWPLLLDPDDRTAVDFGVTGPPETFVVDATGTIVVKFRGQIGPGSLEEVFGASQGLPSP